MPLHDQLEPLANYHLHTEYSVCCEDITTERLAAFLPTWPHPFSITDHSAQFTFGQAVWREFHSDEAPAIIAARADETRERVRRYLEHLRSLDGGRVLVGTELDVLPDGRPVFAEDLLPQLDVIVGAVHALAAVRHGEPAREVLAEWRVQCRALLGLGAHIIAHPFRYLVQKQVPVGDEEIDWLVAAARAHGAALEINSHYPCPEFDQRMIHACLKQGVRLAVGTDAHRWAEITDFSYHYEQLAACGVTTRAQRDAVLFHHA